VRRSLAFLSFLTVLLGCTDRADTIYLQGLAFYEKKEYEKALPFILAAVEGGDKDGMAVLGTMYLFGQGVENDAKKATQWLELAAGRGQVDAQSILGIMYATGQGVARNILKRKNGLR
jgi:TPR repeat protein